TTMWAWSALLRRPTPSSKSLIHKNFFLASGAPSPINGSREVLDLGGEIRRHPQRGNTPLGGTHMRHPERARARVRSLSGLSLSFAALLTWACTGTTTGGDDGALDPGGDDDGGGGGGNGDGDGDGGGIDPGTPGEGVVSVVLHPGPSIATGEPVVVSFGAPFPPGAVSDAGLLSARLGEQELA